MKKLLWIGDAAVTTGFATVTHNLLEHLRHYYDVTVLATNYYGEEHNLPYELIPAGNKLSGQYIESVFAQIGKPDIVVIVNDIWRVAMVADVLATVPESYAYVPVDGLNIHPHFTERLNLLTGVATYTQFGVDQLVKAGLKTPQIIPHGINLADFYPEDKQKLREEMFNLGENEFVVGNVNRNQPRKRLDLTVRYFGILCNTYDVDASLYLHCDLDDVGYDVLQLANFYGVTSQILLTSDKMKAGKGVPLKYLRAIYSNLDLQITTTTGEGWGLTTMEGMACGVPQLVPDFAGLGEWARPAAGLVSCSSTQTAPRGLNMIGHVPDEKDFVEYLHTLYSHQIARERLAERGLALVREPQYRWENISEKFRSFLEGKHVLQLSKETTNV